MTLNDAILHCFEKANELKQEAKYLLKDSIDYKPCLECAKEHEQLAEWLTQLKEIKEAYESNYQIQDVIEVCVKFWG